MPNGQEGTRHVKESRHVESLKWKNIKFESDFLINLVANLAQFTFEHVEVERVVIVEKHDWQEANMIRILTAAVNKYSN